jgi:DNA modification methylase
MKRPTPFVAQPTKFQKALHKYGIWPTTVWEIRDNERLTIRLKDEIRDVGEYRTNAGSKHGFKTTWTNKAHTTTSIFNPAIACHILNLYGAKATKVFDPFTGGGTRAIICGQAGLDYTGVEIRQAEVDHIKGMVTKMGLTKRITIIRGDARKVPQIESQSHDFLLTCPPYWNLERYEGGASDLSMIRSYSQFLAELELAVIESTRVLKPGSVSVWVVGLHRDKQKGRPGELVCLNHDVARMHQRNGFVLKEEIIIYRKNDQALARSGTFEKGSGFLVRRHEYALVFERI